MYGVYYLSYLKILKPCNTLIISLYIHKNIHKTQFNLKFYLKLSFNTLFLLFHLRYKGWNFNSGRNVLGMPLQIIKCGK